MDTWATHISGSAAELFEFYYADLTKIARALRKRKNLSDTLLTSDLINEAFLKHRSKLHFKSDEHFLCSVALSMRHVALDHIKSKKYQKRGSGLVNIPIHDVEHQIGDNPFDEAIIDISNLMDELTSRSQRQAQIVDCRFFAGFTNQETASMLKIDEKTVRRDWNKARVWFAMKLSAEFDMAPA